MSAPRPRDLARVADWVDGRLSEPESAELAATIADDRGLQGDLEWLEDLHRTAEMLPQVAGPPLLRQLLRQRFRRWARTQAGVPKTAIELFPLPVFDSRRDRVALSVRSAGALGEAVHLAWRTELAELVVDARPMGAGRYRLAGQVLLDHATSSPVFDATAKGAGILVRSVDGDDVGRFHLDVPAGITELIVSNGEITISAGLDTLGDPTGDQLAGG